MAAEPTPRASFTDYNSAFNGPKGHSHENSPDYAHRRSYSDIYNSPPSFMNKAAYAIQPYTPTSFQYRERRTSSWDFSSSDPELMRKKRLASYRIYGIEGTVKTRVKKSFRWMKGKYNEIVYGFK